MRKCVVLTVLVAITYMVGCAMVPFAREVKKKPTEGGVIALRLQHSPEDRAKADALMRSNCGSAEAQVMEEGEVVVGQKTNTVANSSFQAGSEGTQHGVFTFGGSDPGVATNSSQETSQVKEWQITYKCSGRTGSAGKSKKNG